MPHVIVKLWPGKSEQQKTRLAEATTKDVMSILHYGEKSVSVAMEEVKPASGPRRCTEPNSKTIWTSSTRNLDTTKATSEKCAPGRKNIHK